MATFALNDGEEIVLEDTMCRWIPGSAQAHACAFYLTTERVVVEQDENAMMGFLVKALVPATQQRIVLDISLDDLKEFREEKLGLGKVIYIESTDGRCGKVLTDKRGEFLARLE